MVFRLRNPQYNLVTHLKEIYYFHLHVLNFQIRIEVRPYDKKVKGKSQP
jgi:hypothetical protein